MKLCSLESKQCEVDSSLWSIAFRIALTLFSTLGCSSALNIPRTILLSYAESPRIPEWHLSSVQLNVITDNEAKHEHIAAATPKAYMVHYLTTRIATSLRSCLETVGSGPFAAVTACRESGSTRCWSEDNISTDPIQRTGSRRRSHYGILFSTSTSESSFHRRQHG